MKHESIVVVYDSCQAIAEEIADKLGAEIATQLFRGTSLSGKNLAVMVALGNRHDNGIYADAFCRELKENGAHIVGDYLYAGSPKSNLNNWICAISPNL